MGRIKPKKEPTFGKPKKKEAFISDDVYDVQIPEEGIRAHQKATFGFRDKAKEKERLEALKQQLDKKKSSKKNILVIKEYMTWLHREYGAGVAIPMEIHHWMPRGRIGQNDYFVCCLSPEKHREIHAGSLGVNGFIEEQTLEKLLNDSFVMFRRWTESDEAKNNKNLNLYKAMVKKIGENELDYDFVLSATRKFAEEIRMV